MAGPEPQAQGGVDHWRELDAGERLTELLNGQAACGFNIVVNLGLDIKLDPRLLKRAAAAVQDEYPLLRCCITGSDPRFRFAPVSGPIPIEVHGDSTREVIDRELERPFPLGHGPLCRLALTDGEHAGTSDLILVAHHAILDGNSLRTLIHRLLHIHAALAGDRVVEFRRVSRPPDLAFGPLSRPVWTLRQRLYAIYRLCRYLIVVRKGRLIPFDGVETDAAKRRMARYPWTLSEEHSRALIEATRANGATVTGVLCAALLILGARHTLRGVNKNSVRLNMTCNVSLWPLLPEAVQRERLGCFVTVAQAGIPVQRDPSFWMLARQCSAVMRRPRETLRDVSMILAGLVKKTAASGLRKLSANPSRCGRLSAIHVSNLGIFDPPGPATSAHIRSLHVVAPMQVQGAMLWLSVASVRSCLQGTFVTVSPLISDETSSAMARELQSMLTEL